MDDNASALQKDVTEHLQRGWNLHGTLQVTPTTQPRTDVNPNPQPIFVQAVIKD